MGDVKGITSETSRALYGLSPWNWGSYIYSVTQLNLGSDSISSLEIVSVLNSFNIGTNQYHYNQTNCTQRYNPKVYFGTIQTTAENWNFDYDSARENLQNGAQKSGSWPRLTL